MSEEITEPTEQAVKNELQGDVFEEQRSLSQRMSNAKLSALRAQNPFVPIVMFPNSTITVELAAGAPIDVDLPQGTKYIQIDATSEYFISRNGNARVPTAPVANASPINVESGSWRPDPSTFVYVEELRYFSIVSVGAANKIAICCFQQL